MEKKETLDAICERIKALEDEICALRLQNKRMRVVIAALVVIAVLPYLIAAGMQTQTFSVLRVERLEFVQDGELMAGIVGGKTIAPGSGLLIYDKENKPLVRISSISYGSNAGSRGINLLDKEGKEAISLHTSSDGSNSVVVFNNNEKIVAILGTMSELNPKEYTNSGYLIIGDRTGEMKISLFVSSEGDGMIGVKSRDGKSGVSIGGQDTGGRIEISRNPRLGNTKTSAVTLCVTENGLGYIGISNSLGLPIWSTPLR